MITFPATLMRPQPPRNPAAWYRADFGKYDATSGGSLVTADLGTVARLEDASGSGRHATQGTAGNRLLWNNLTARLMADIDFKRYLDAPGSFTFDRQNFSVFIVGTMVSLRRPVISGTVAGNQIIAATSSDTCNLYIPGSGASSDSWKLTAFNSSVKATSTIPYTTDRTLFGFVGRSTGFEGWSRNGSNSIAALTSGTSTISTMLGWVADNSVFQGSIDDVLVYNRALSSAEITDQLWPYAIARGVPRTQSNQIVFVGDSITQGLKSTRNQNWPSLITGLSSVHKRCTAEASITLATISGESARENSLFRSSETNVLVLWAGTNDIVLSGTSGATVHSTMETLCGTYQGAGYKVIVATIIDRNFTGPQQTEADAFNTALRGDHAWADGFVDLADDARLSDCTDTDYFNADQIHLNDTGLAVVAELMQPEIESLL